MKGNKIQIQNVKSSILKKNTSNLFYISAECTGNRLQSCALNELGDDQDAKAKFVTCQMNWNSEYTGRKVRIMMLHCYRFNFFEKQLIWNLYYRSIPTDSIRQLFSSFTMQNIYIYSNFKIPMYKKFYNLSAVF